MRSRSLPCAALPSKAALSLFWPNSIVVSVLIGAVQTGQADRERALQNGIFDVPCHRGGSPGAVERPRQQPQSTNVLPVPLHHNLGLQAGRLKAKFLLNLDSEEEGYLTIGCAGGVDTIATRKLNRTAPPAGSRAYRLKVSGLKGGHSGIDINAGRGNALRLLAQVLGLLRPEFNLALASIKGGNKRNAIPREASAMIFLDPAKEQAIRQGLAAHETHWRAALGAFDSGLHLALETGEAAQAMSSTDADALIQLLLALPHGVEAMSPDIKGLVQASTNLGVIETREDAVEVNLLTRSSIDASKAALTERIAATCALAGFESYTSGGYPGWKPEPEASLVRIVNDANQAIFGKPLKIIAIHAGLECGLIGEKYTSMEMVSFGPSMWDVHTPDEHVSVPSVGNFWKLLVAVLEAM